MANRNEKKARVIIVKLNKVDFKTNSVTKDKQRHLLLLFSHSVASDSMQPHGLQCTRLPCPSLTPRACSYSCPLESVSPSNHLILCRPLLLLPSIFPSIRIFSNVSVFCIQWPQYWSFSISPSSEYSRLIFFRINWFDLLAVQGTFRSLLQHQFKSINFLALSFLYGPTFNT